MRHAKFYDLNPQASTSHFATFSRRQLDQFNRGYSQAVLDEFPDYLAMREIVLRAQGIDTLQNLIRTDHGLPARKPEPDTYYIWLA